MRFYRRLPGNRNFRAACIEGWTVKIRKISCLPAALALCILLSNCASGRVHVSDGNPLFKFVKFPDGTYGYDYSSAVRYSAFSDEAVMLPGYSAPEKRQFRTAWVATVNNIDIPLAPSPENFRAEFLKVLDTLEEWNMNAVIFQVRPMLDAFYQSQINPWSQFLSGKQGGNPGWDPLEWMVSAAHERAIEFHAWFNPYRVTATNYRWLSVPGYTAAQLEEMDTAELLEALNSAGILADGNFAVRNPEFVYRFNGRLYLDAGYPEVRRHIVDTVAEVARNYDIDAVHFDDYFYPYAAGGLEFGAAGEDARAFELYGRRSFPGTKEGMDRWRRENNTSLVRAVSREISAINRREAKAVQFGISPFGIWEHRENDSRGSYTPTGSSSTYSGQIFADTRLWVKDQLVDYILPQIYWSFDQRAAPYGELVRWWDSVVRGTRVNLYIGHALYKQLDSAANEPAWMNSEELVNQLKYNSLFKRVSGSGFFSYTRMRLSDAPDSSQAAVYDSANQALRLLKAQFGSYQALVPAKPWLQRKAPKPPANLVRNGNTVTWNEGASSNSRYYVVYRVPKSQASRLRAATANPENIVAKVWRNGGTHSFTDTSIPVGQGDYAYIVTAVNAAHVESAPRLAKG